MISTGWRRTRAVPALRVAEAHGRSRRERRAEARRWRRQRSRALPSPDAAGRWLAGFHDAGEEARRQAGRAFIPAASRGVAGLWRVNGELLRMAQVQHPVAQAKPRSPPSPAVRPKTPEVSAERRPITAMSAISSARRASPPEWTRKTGATSSAPISTRRRRR